MRIYKGMRVGRECRVLVVDGKHEGTLPPRWDLRQHSLTGFQWGYGGDGAAQLALAMCCDALNDDDERALAVYQAFKRVVLAPLQDDEWLRARDWVVGVIEGLELLARERGEQLPRTAVEQQTAPLDG